MQTIQRERKLETKKISRIVWEYSLPAIVGTLVNALYNIVDRIYIGHGVGPLAISGLGITLPVMALTSALGMLVGAGASSRISISLGKKNKTEAEQILGNSLLLLILFNVIITAGCLIFLKPLLMAFGASEQTYPYARDFLQIVISGNFFMSTCYSFNAMMRASGYPQKAMYTMLIGAIINVVLDPIFIFVFKMGIRGAAIATVISMFIGMLFVMYHFVQPKSAIRLKREYIRFNWPILAGIISIGLSPFFMQVAASAVAVIMNTSLLAYGGDLAVGAYSIFISMSMMIVMIVIGLNQGLQPIIGYNYGAGNYRRVKDVVKYGLKVGTLITCAGFLIGMITPNWFAAAFTSDAHLIDITSRGIRLAIIAFPIIGFQIVISNFFQSIGKANKAIVLSLSRQVLFLIPAILILPRFWALDGVWLANTFSDTLSALLTLIFFIVQVKALNKMEAERTL